MISATLPFALATFASSSKKRPDTWFIIMSIGCAVITDSFLGYALILVSVLTFIACSTKSPVGAFLAALVTVPPVFLIVSDFADSNLVSVMREKSLDAVLVSEGRFTNFWTASLNVNGWIATALFVVALLFVFQRIFGSTVLNRAKRNVLASGTLAASLVLTVACSFLFNPFSDFIVYASKKFLLSPSVFGRFHAVITKEENVGIVGEYSAV